MIDTYSSDDQVRLAYNLAAGETINFSKASIENALFYAMAVAIYLFECILEQYLNEIDTKIKNEKPHTCNWYCSKAKEFQYGFPFDESTMQYDNGSATDDQIADSKIVKYCSVTEEGVEVILKVAGDGPEPLNATQLSAFQTYMYRIKDAGVFLSFRNVTADSLKTNITIWYNPMLISQDGSNIQSGNMEVKQCIENFIHNLPFNGEFHVDKLEDAIQLVPGVEIVKINTIQSKKTTDISETYHDIVGYEQPYSGYYKIYEPGDLNINYIAYNSAQDD